MASNLKPTKQGAMVVIGLLVFGLIILGGLYLTPVAHSPAAPSNVPPGAPLQRLRFVAYDLARQPPMKDPLLGEIEKINADYVLLQGVNEDDSIEIARSLAMLHWFHPQLYQRSERLSGKKGVWGNLILSRQAIYEGAPLGGRRGGFGGWGKSVVDDHAFYVANLHLSPGGAANDEVAEFEKTWREVASPPMVVAVLPSDARPPSGLTFLIPTAGGSGEFFYLSKGWQVVAAGTIGSDTHGLVPRWIDVTKADSPATQATLQQSNPAADQH